MGPIHDHERLRIARRRLRFSQAYVAAVLGVRQSTISHYETGRRIVPDDKKLILAKLYNLDVEEIFIPRAAVA